MFGRSPRSLRSTWTAGIVTAGVATGLLGTAIPANAVVGAAVTDASYGFTANLHIGEGDQTRACSGALVDAEWILTAAACFAADPVAGGTVAAGKPALKTVATVGRNDLLGTGGQVAEVVELAPREGTDLVLARLAAPATGVTPVPLAATPVAQGEALKAAGFGRTKTEWRPEKLHAATFGVDAVADGTLSLTGATAGDAICAGDTGGPLLRQKSGGGFELVGINTRSWQGGCFGSSDTRTDAVATRTDGMRFGAALPAGQTLRAGDILVSASARVAMRADGNLVVTSVAGKVLWSTGTAGNAGATAHFGTDGNLVVRSASGTTLWQSGTSASGGSAAVLNSGDFVIRDASGTAVWSSNTAVRGDLDHDGRGDMSAWYDFPQGTDATYTFSGKADGSLSGYRKTYTSAVGQWGNEHMKRATGDFNGDGRADFMAIQGYGDSSVKLFISLGQADGTYSEPTKAWEVVPNHVTFHESYMTPLAGDFNGDGYDDVAIWNVDRTTGVTKLWTLTSNGKGGVVRLIPSEWSGPKGTWLASRSKFVTGDFDGDGRDEVGLLYGQGDNSIRTYVFPTTTEGVFTTPSTWWTGPAATTFDWNRAKPRTGDFDGDRRDDLMFWYDHTDGTDTVRTLLSTGTAFGPTPKLTLSGRLDVSSMQLVVGDYNGDGRDDLGAMYGDSSSGAVRLWTWTAKPDAMFNGALPGWESSPNSFIYGQTYFMHPYYV
ncbi:FG-GAP-like repeat-containing protein [Streptomyces sp. TRM49041]|uniref:FG-GAP-like repeat-containing protein n=1 Tax=Streptomyces sp. TRM49041 TaxID=2603216 RepID=UPI0037D9F93D